MMVRDFAPDGSDKKLLDLQLWQPNLSEKKTIQRSLNGWSE